LEAGETHGVAPLQVPVDVVLQDHEIVAIGELEHARRDFGAHARTRRVVRDGIEDEQLRPLARQQAFERGNVRTVGPARHADNARAECREAREHHEPCRVLDEHQVPRREEAARDEIDGLGGAGTGHDLLGRHHDARLAEPRAQRLAQR
jgi:hypothetical protein